MYHISKILLVLFFGYMNYERLLANDIYLASNQTNKTQNYSEDIQQKPLIEFVKIPKIRDINDKCTIFSDVLSHSPQKPWGNDGGRHINVHETAHGIHSDLRNEYEKLLKYRLNAFYSLNGNVIILKESNITIRHVVKFVPLKLRSYRWNLYFVEKLPDWNDQPSYILDEWVAYILGSKCAVEDNNKNIATIKSDAVSGCLDFSIYAVAFAMAVKTHDNEYWKNNPQFKEVIKYYLIQAEKTLGEGLEIEAFNSEQQDNLYRNFLYDQEAKDIRQFLLDHFDGIFIH